MYENQEWNDEKLSDQKRLMSVVSVRQTLDVPMKNETTATTFLPCLFISWCMRVEWNAAMRLDCQFVLDRNAEGIASEEHGKSEN